MSRVFKGTMSNGVEQDKMIKNATSDLCTVYHDNSIFFAKFIPIYNYSTVPIKELLGNDHEMVISL